MKYLILIVFTLASCSAFAQTSSSEGEETEVNHKWSVSMPYIVPDEIIFGWGKRTSIQMVELHAKL